MTQKKLTRKFTYLLLALFTMGTGYSQDLNIDSNDFIIRKGRYYGSLTFSLNQRKAENEDQLVRQVIDQNRYTYRIIGNAGYAIKDNMTLGMSMGYGRQKEEITYLGENDEEITSNLLEQGFSIAPNMRNYIPIGKGQLQIFVQSELGFTFGESLQRIRFTQDQDKIEGEFFELNLGVSPGLLLFFDRHWAFEASVGIAGLSTRIEEEVVNDDQENRQRIEQTSIDLKINLLELGLGVSFYF